MHTIPDESEVSNQRQAVLYQTDWDTQNEALNGYGIAPYSSATACKVTAQASPNLTVQIGAGSIVSNWTTYSITSKSTSNGSINVDSTNAKWVLIELTPSNTVVVNQGTAAQYPIMPAKSNANNVVVAGIFVPAGINSIDNSLIRDMRNAVSGVYLHASTHSSGGSDQITIAESQVTNLTTDLAAKASLTGAETLTNKRITKRIATLPNSATVAIDCDSYDGGKVSELSQTTTFSNPTGTPTEFQTYVLRIKTTTSQSISFGNQYRSGSDIATPTSTTGNGKTDYLGFQWNASDSKWDLLAKVMGY